MSLQATEILNAFHQSTAWDCSRFAGLNRCGSWSCRLASAWRRPPAVRNLVKLPARLGRDVLATSQFMLNQIQDVADTSKPRQFLARQVDVQLAFHLKDEANQINRIESKLFAQHHAIRQLRTACPGFVLE